MTRILRRDAADLSAMPASLRATAGLCVAVFLAQVLGAHVPALDFRLVENFGLVPALTLKWPWPQAWRLATYLFLHGGYSHLFFNLLALWMFGLPVIAQWGDREFVKYFLLCGLGAAAAQLAVSPRSMTPVIGFSGSVFGLLVAFAMLYPDAVVYVYFLIPMKAAHMAILFGVIELFAGGLGTSPGIAHFAHLGGAATGYVYLRWWWVWKRQARRLAGRLGGAEGTR